MTVAHIKPAEVETFTLDWGTMKWFVSPVTIPGAGDTVYIPMGTLHSTLNTGWRTLRLLVTYTPGGEEQALTMLPDFTRHPAGEIVSWERTAPGHA
jgi:oxalate decarboxylase/phosphoglucose isomerase-like protein (cupin superfamily)